MDCVDITTVIQYLIIGAVYASIKHFAFWDYHKSRSLWTKWHHYWTEACFWPVDFLINTAKLFIYNNKGE